MPFFYIALGGALGSIIRYAFSIWTAQMFIFARFPIGTFMVNAAGSLIIGVLAGLNEKHQFFSEDIRLFLFTGLMGGFTTFSAFSLEVTQLLRRGETMIAASYVILSIIVGIFLAGLGFYLSQKA